MRGKDKKEIEQQFPVQLNRMLAKERGIRKYKIVSEMERSNDTTEAYKYAQRLFDDYKKKEFNEEASNSAPSKFYTFC